jgi:GR25 family glycosyltransferase involved in LPS biosynthesis
MIEFYVINLKKREKRLKDFFFRCNFDVPINVFYGFDGSLNYENLNSFQSNMLDAIKKVTYYPEENYLGVLGCWISHLTLWEMLANSTCEYFTIFEDDAFFTEDFQENLGLIINNIPPHIDILYLGGNFSQIKTPPEGRSWTPLKLHEKITIYTTSDYINPISDTDRNFTRTAHAYIINRKFAKQCIKKLNEILDFQQPLLPVDEFLNELKFTVSYYDLFPQITYSPFKYESDIWKG